VAFTTTLRGRRCCGDTFKLMHEDVANVTAETGSVQELKSEAYIPLRRH
jgi:hypothetical protein